MINETTWKGRVVMPEKKDIILEGLTLSVDLLEKADELADIVCKITGENYQQVDEFIPQLVAQRIAKKRAEQNGSV